MNPARSDLENVVTDIAMREEIVASEETESREVSEVRETIEIVTEIDATGTAAVIEIATHSDTAIEEAAPVLTTSTTTSTAKR